MTSEDGPAAQRWPDGAPTPGFGAPVRNAQDFIDVAKRARAAGLDSPTLREIASAAESADVAELEALLESAADELGLFRPRARERRPRLTGSSATSSRLPAESIRFEIGLAPEHVGGFKLLVFVDDVEMTSRGAGVGMSPFDTIIPTNQLVASPDPHTAPIARCTCGIYGCGSTDVRIVRDGASVHWDWLLKTPMDHGVTFPADQYDAEVARIAADRSWERPQDTAARLILTGADRDALASRGLLLSWAERDFRDPSQFKVALKGVGVRLQVFLRFPFDEHSPEDVATEAIATLATEPETWAATCNRMRP